MTSPPISIQDKSNSNLQRKFSTKSFFINPVPKNPSPTVYDSRTITDSSSLDPSAAALAASSHLTAVMSGSQSQPSPHSIPQPSPTSPGYSPQTVGAPRSRADGIGSSRSQQHDDLPHNSVWNAGPGNSAWTSSTSTIVSERDPRDIRNPTPVQAVRPLRLGGSASGGGGGGGGGPTGDPIIDPPLSSGMSGMSSITTGSSTNPQVEVFKSFRVSIDDPCHKVLPVALKKYNITENWRQYALYIVHGDQERCLGLNEKPLILFKQLDKEGRKPMFMLRKHAAPAEGHVSTIPGSGSSGGASAGFDSGRGAWQGSVSIPGGVL